VTEKKIVDQPPPTGDGTPIWDLVVDDMRERDNLGRQRYNTPLKSWNGRDALVDAYQEVLDLAVYMRQEIEERKSIQEICNHIALIPGGEDCTPQNVLETIAEIEEKIHLIERANLTLRRRVTEFQNEASYDAGFKRGCQAVLHLIEKLQGKRVSNDLLEQAMNLKVDDEASA
jgi:hypothetical protein